MDISGWEVVEQEKCKLIYAKFFDGIQCFDATLGHLHIATPDFEFNEYDPALKKLTTKTFSVFPVTPADPAHIKRPNLLLHVDINISGLVVKLTADTYEKTRIIPMFYLESCDTLAFNGLKICTAIYQEELVTSVSFDTGRLDFISSTVFKYTDAENKIHLYRLKDYDKSIIVYDIPDNFSNIYYFPLAYYVEKLPAKLERSIRLNYRYTKPYKTVDSNIFPCEYTGNNARYLFNSNIEYIKQSDNMWQFRLSIFTESYTLLNNRLTISVLLRDNTTGIYSLKISCFDFYAVDTPINLNSGVFTTESRKGRRELIVQLGRAKCRAEYTEYTKELDGSYTLESSGNKVYSYGYPTCPNIATYDTTVCECIGGNLCWDKFVLPCEDCDPETGKITDTCLSDPEHGPGFKCTIFDCFKPWTYYACVCGSEFGIQQFPAVQALFLEASCRMLPYNRYILTRNGDVMGHVSLAPLMPASEMGIVTGPWLKFFNVYDIMSSKTYVHESGTKFTIDPLVYLVMKYLNVDFEEIPANRAAWRNKLRGYVTLPNFLASDYIEISYYEVIGMIPEAASIKLDWGSEQSSHKGAYTVYGQPCEYQSVYIDVTRDGHVTHAYSSRYGYSFIYPRIINPITSTSRQADYLAYCDKVKWLYNNESYTYALFKLTIDQTAPYLEI